MLWGVKIGHRYSLAGPIKLWDIQRKFQISFLKRSGLKPHHTLLDYGCGPLRGGIPIINYLNMGNYHGVDIREEAIDEAGKELGDNGLTHKLPRLTHIRNIETLNLHSLFDFIWAFSTAIHMPDDALRDFLRFSSFHLKARGALYMNVNIGPRRTGGKFLDFNTYIRPLKFYIDSASKYNLKIIDSEPSQTQTMLKMSL